VSAVVSADLLRRYDRPGPRYTSYPTAVEFTPVFDAAAYEARLVAAAGAKDEPLSLYLHLPFCEERCTFCGCMVVITKKREVAQHYLEYVHRELDLLASRLGGRRRVVQHHWGGGTPTYLSLHEIEALHARVTRHFDVAPEAEVAIEIDPRVTSVEQLALLRRLGFNRLSMGVQDFAPDVQQAVNRIQGERETRALFEAARKLGFSSINLDLIYGLPLQTAESFEKTLGTVAAMRPDRIAVYSYAHVRWFRGHQQRLAPLERPGPELKLELISRALERFLTAGYQAIGMDHFALPEDDLARAQQTGTLHRNFMGYTTQRAPDMLGIGVSAIGDVRGAFVQNVKSLATYYRALDAGQFPVERGFATVADDRVRRHVIIELMCNFRVDVRDVERRYEVDFESYFREELAELRAGPLSDGLVRLDPAFIEIPPGGRLLVRNVCMVFDRYLRARAAEKPVFSRTI
jgi:oxygen-independent coproporphyrinogen III oxidase